MSKLSKFIANNFTLVAAIFFLFAGIALVSYNKVISSIYNENTIQKNYTKTLKHLIRAKNKIIFETDSLNNHKDLFEKINNIVGDFKKYGIEAFVLSKDSIIVWTTNQLPITSNLLKKNSKIISTPNGSLLRKVEFDNGNKKLICLLILNKNYPIENEYLTQKQNKYIFAHSNYEISKTGKPIKDIEGFTAFYITKKNKTISDNIFTTALFLIFISLIIFAKYVADRKNLTYIIATIFFLFALYLISIFFQNKFAIQVFQPYIFSSSKIFPNILSALTFSLFIWFIVYILPNTFSRKIKIAISIIIYPLAFVFLFHFLKTLIVDSTVDFRIHNIKNWSIYTAFMILIISLIIFSFVNFVQKTFPECKNKNYCAVILFSIPVFYLILLFISNGSENKMFISLIYFLFLFLIFFYQTSTFSTKHILSLLMLAIIITFITTYFSNKKEKNIKELLVAKLVEERDFVIETLSKEIISRIENDTSWQNLLNDTTELTIINQKTLELLKKSYLTGYWNNYDIQITCCTKDCNLEIINENKIENCYEYFLGIATKIGTPIVKNKIFFLDNNNGRISYLLIITPSRFKNWKIFIEVDSKLVSVKQGYPELMLSYNVTKNNFLSDYSYAKYKHGKLYSQYGTFSYPLSFNIFSNIPNMSEINLWGYQHLIYKTDTNTFFILSHKKRNLWDFLQSLSYIFLIIVVASFAFNFNIKSLSNIKHSLRYKIQYLIFTLQTLFFIVTAAILIYTTKNNFDNFHKQDLEEKLESIMSELSEKNIQESYNKNSLSKFINKLSEIFYTDIHIYDTTGTLLVTSIPIILEKNIQAPIINPKSYFYLNKIKTSRYIHKENIGKMKFLSAYTPLLNKNNIPVMYVNLPYFTKQTEITKQLLSAITSIINIFVFLIILSSIFTVIISEKITVPLTIIRKHLQQIKLNNKNKKIKLEAETEIGELVKEYNKMIDKLEESTQILAKTEREYAWREMAKQVAHDIKNPLTPMKLSIQYLQQTWEAHKDKDLKEFIDKTAKTIINQIDTITFIVNEFSNFAKTPEIKLEPLNIKEQVENLINLYKVENISFELKSELKTNTNICFDKNHFNRVVSNIIKNAIQSIPRSKKGKIKITIYENEQKKIVLSISDNGIGIPKEIRNKIFSPNFTTKASGMGLGLAIAKKVIESANGKIYFETSDKGTTFFIEFSPCN